MWTGIRTRIDERLVGSGVFVSMRELCVGGTTLWSCGGVDFLWLRSICVLSGAIHTCACTSLVWSSTREQNTSLTLITHFSHLNKARLTPHISSVQTPSGIQKLSPFLPSSPPSTSLSPTSCYPTSVSCVGYLFLFLVRRSESGTRWTLFLKSIIMLHCEDTRSNQLSHLENGACTIKLKCFASVDQMDASLFPAQRP